MTHIRVTNPSNEPRGGLVEIRVREPIAALQRGFEIRDPYDRTLPSQLDVIDPDDRSRDTLVFALRDVIPPYGSVELNILPASPAPFEPGLSDPRIAREMHGVKLINQLLDIYISLVPEHILGAPFYAGAATSVVMTLDGLHRRQEFLDAINMFEAHDLQKRCMQIDLVQLSHPAADPIPLQSEWLVHEPYIVVADNHGPLRATVTIASREFTVGSSRYRLYRALSVYRDDAILELVYVRGDRDAPWFTARYFAYMDMGLEIVPVHYPYIPDWLSIGCEWPPQHGYGFCTDVHATPIQHPHPEFKGPNADRTFSWSLQWSDGATCLHLFKMGVDPEQLADETGRAWYYRIFQPLRGELV